MGSRASYVVIENGAISAYASKWGAQTVPGVVSWGLEVTPVYARAMGRVDWLYDTDWAEGGILLDIDTRTLLFWGGENIAWTPSLRRLFLPVVRMMWQGWSVAWPVRGIVDFAEYPGVARSLGMEASSVISAHAGFDWQPYPELLLQSPNNHAWIGTVITVKWEDEHVADYALNDDPAGYLTYGQSLLTFLRQCAPSTLRPEHEDDSVWSPDGGAYLDVAERHLWMWENRTINPVHQERVARAWPGWQVEGHVDGLAHQVALSGRPSSLVMPPVAQACAELTKELSHQVETVAREMNQMTLWRPELETSAFVSDFHQMDRFALLLQERRDLLAHLVQTVAREQAKNDSAQ